MERYESYKDSGVKWIGEIPGHWEVKRLKYVTNIIFLGKTPKYSLEENEYIIIGQRCNQLDGIKMSDCKYSDEKFYLNRKKYEFLYYGDILLNSLGGGSVGRVGYFDLKENGILTDGHIIVIRSNFEYNNRYLYYFLGTKRKDFELMACGSTNQMFLLVSDIYKLFVPVPPKSEQTAIANYLDSVTSKIDEAISQQQKMIDLLNERKQIIIQNAVTKGLDPNAKMKDSGVEWIGEIPENWKISLIGHLFYIKAGGDAKPKLYSMAKDEIHKYPVYTNCNDSNNVYAYTSIPYFEANTITVTGRGDIGKAFFRKTPYDAIIRLLSLKPRIELDCRFFTFFIDKVIPFTSDSAAVAQLSAIQLKNFVCCFPSKREQSAIADYLDSETSKIDTSISQCNKMISLLQERKQIIINDVVTGKVKVV